eukprot:SAG25_NODE_14268_length_257_cov_0.645570_1_plen_21_part_01
MPVPTLYAYGSMYDRQYLKRQ